MTGMTLTCTVTIRCKSVILETSCLIALPQHEAAFYDEKQVYE